MATRTSTPIATDDVERYLHEQRHKRLLRFITCGSVDDGKSTLIGRSILMFRISGCRRIMSSMRSRVEA